MKEFLHPELNTPITAIGGNYVLVKEIRMPFDDQEVLYMTGVAVFDTTCCGSGGCSYAMVPGFVRKWKYRTDGKKHPVSQVEPISDERVREKIRERILKQEMVYQVDFL